MININVQKYIDRLINIRDEGFEIASLEKVHRLPGIPYIAEMTE